MEMDPHSPKTDPLAAPMLHLASLIPNLGPYPEVSISPQAEAWFTPAIEVRNGVVQVPTGPGMGDRVRSWPVGERAGGVTDIGLPPASA
jgi:D-galactarolactone cycloisomerase